MDKYSILLDGKCEEVNPQIYVEIFKKNCEILLEANKLLIEDINGIDP